MRKFIIHIASASVYLALFMVIWHLFFMNYWSILESIEERTWIWGDSQMVQGLDPNQLEQEKPTFSFARHGNGYFDLVSFSHRIPKKSDVIVGFGPLFYRYRNDRSRAGFQLDAIKALFEVTESKAFEVKTTSILRNNVYHEFSVSNLDSDVHRRYSNKADSLKRLDYIDKILKVISKNEFSRLFEFKDRWFKHSISEIQGKSNRLTIISWPVCDQLLITDFNMIQNHYDSVLMDISNEFELPIDTVIVNVETDPFHDATHFSHHAVSLVTNRIQKELIEKSNSRIIVIRFNQTKD